MTFGAGAETSAEPVVSLRMADGSEVRRTLRDVRARQVVAAVPWRGAKCPEAVPLPGRGAFTHPLIAILNAAFIGFFSWALATPLPIPDTLHVDTTGHADLDAITDWCKHPRVPGTIG